MMMIPQHERRTKNVVGNENNYIDHDTPNTVYDTSYTVDDTTYMVDDITTKGYVHFMFQEVYDDDTSAWKENKECCGKREQQQS